MKLTLTNREAKTITGLIDSEIEEIDEELSELYSQTAMPLHTEEFDREERALESTIEYLDKILIKIEKERRKDEA